MAAAKGPMKKISDLFSDEEKKQLSYLGSMLRREPTSVVYKIRVVLRSFQEFPKEFVSY